MHSRSGGGILEISNQINIVSNVLSTSGGELVKKKGPG
jgi:hypothetical protein